MNKLAPIVFAAALAAAACSGPEDQAAKARIFSPEDPPRELQAAAEKLDAQGLANQPARVERVLAISAREAAARVGPHTQKVRVQFAWEREGRKVELSETRQVALGNGGDFHVLIENDERQGMEWVKVDGVSYARSRFAPFRERRRDRGSSEHVVTSAYATLDTFHELVQGALKLTPAGSVTVAGRAARKYTVGLGEVRKSSGEKRLPEVIFPKDGPDRDTVLRLAALEGGKPESLKGTLVVDEATSLPLQADLAAVVAVSNEEGMARLQLSVKLDVEGIGATKIAVPKHIEDAPRPPGVVATLKAYGITPPADEAAAKADEPPEDE